MTEDGSCNSTHVCSAVTVVELADISDGCFV